MNKELEILRLADYYEKFSHKGCEAYLIINKKMAEHKCLFGFVTLTEDFSAVSELFSMLEARAQKLGYTELAGPLNYSTWMSYRWAVNMFDTHYFPDCENPPFYPQYIERLGYSPLYTYRSATVKIDNALFKLGEAMLKQKEAEGFEFKFFCGEEAYSRVSEIYEISADAFCGGPLYSEIPYEYFTQIYLTWTKSIKPDMFIAYKDNEPCGYVYGYENIGEHTYISKTSAVKKKYQKNKLYLALLYLGCKYVRDRGYDDMIYHFQCEQRPTFRRFEDNIESNEKKYAVYFKEL